MLAHPGKIITYDELQVGSRGTFAAAGFREISGPTKRPVVMRIEFDLFLKECFAGREAVSRSRETFP